MQPGTKPALQLSALFESIAAIALALRQMLAAPCAPDVLKRQVEKLNDLLTAYISANELMQQFLHYPDTRLRHGRRQAAITILRSCGIIDGGDPWV